MIFKDRQGSNLNRKKLKIINQTPTEMIVDIERADENITEEGSKINATVFTEFQNTINNAMNNSTTALSKSSTAETNSTNALAKANTAETNSTNALTKANTAETNTASSLERAIAAENNTANALTKASNAETNSTNALSKATNAETTANDALTKANNADSNASSALTKANQAITDSSSAKSTAEATAESLSNFQATSEILKVSYSPSNADWACDAVKSLSTSFGVNAKENSNIKFCADGDYKMNVVIDGNYYGNNGQSQVAYKSDIPTITKSTSTLSNINASKNAVTITKGDGSTITFNAIEYQEAVVPSTSNTSGKMGLMTGSEKEKLANLFNYIYPIGSIYMTSNSNFDPNVSFTGKWEQIKGRFLLGEGNGYTLDAEGGEATHTLTINEMPNHNHNFYNNGGSTVINGAGANASWVSDNGLAVGVTSTGGGQAHNNMPPYKVVKIWKRIF